MHKKVFSDPELLIEEKTLLELQMCSHTAKRKAIREEL